MRPGEGVAAVDAWVTGRDSFDRDSEGRSRAQEVFDWVTQFNRTQAMQVEQDVARAERAKADVRPADEFDVREVRPPAEPALPDTGWEGREAFDRDSEGRSRAREVFDWVTQFNRTQAMQIEQDVLRAERAKADAAPTGEPEPPREVRPAEPGSATGSEGREAFDRDSEGRSRAREVFDWVTQFNRTQAMQIEQDVLRAERAKAEVTDQAHVNSRTAGQVREPYQEIGWVRPPGVSALCGRHHPGWR